MIHWRESERGRKVLSRQHGKTQNSKNEQENMKVGNCYGVSE